MCTTSRTESVCPTLVCISLNFSQSYTLQYTSTAYISEKFKATSQRQEAVSHMSVRWRPETTWLHNIGTGSSESHDHNIGTGSSKSHDHNIGTESSKSHDHNIGTGSSKSHDYNIGTGSSKSHDYNIETGSSKSHDYNIGTGSSKSHNYNMVTGCIKSRDTTYLIIFCSPAIMAPFIASIHRHVTADFSARV